MWCIIVVLFILDEKFLTVQVLLDCCLAFFPSPWGVYGH